MAEQNKSYHSVANGAAKNGAAVAAASSTNSATAGNRAFSDVEQVVPISSLAMGKQGSVDQYHDLMKMRQLRESFEYLNNQANLQNELINRGKQPVGFQLLDDKDSARREAMRARSGTVPNYDPVDVKEQNKGLFGLFNFNSNKKTVVKKHQMDEEYKQ